VTASFHPSSVTQMKALPFSCAPFGSRTVHAIRAVFPENTGDSAET